MILSLLLQSSPPRGVPGATFFPQSPGSSLSLSLSLHFIWLAADLAAALLRRQQFSLHSLFHSSPTLIYPFFSRCIAFSMSVCMSVCLMKHISMKGWDYAPRGYDLWCGLQPKLARLPCALQSHWECGWPRQALLHYWHSSPDQRPPGPLLSLSLSLSHSL